MPAPLTRRLAGIQFDAQTPTPAQTLPRMDIAVFVGFASAGPLDRPVPVEDAAHFADLFGDDLPLARDATKGTPIYANLAPAVRAFFENGGQRCWVIRVAGNAETNVFPITGLVWIGEDGLQPAFACARAPGSGFDALRAATALAARSVQALGWTPDFQTFDVLLSPRDALQPGDLLRLTFGTNGRQGFFLVKSAVSAVIGLADTRRQTFRVEVQPLGWLAPVREEQTPLGSFEISWLRMPGVPVTSTGELVPAAGSPPDATDGTLAFDVGPGFAPPPGSLVRVEWPAGDPVWVLVDELQANLAAGLVPDSGARLVGRAFWWSASSPTLAADVADVLCEKLTFELRVQSDDAGTTRLIDLGFAPAHPRFWNALPDDAALFAATDFQEAVENAAAQAYEALWTEASEPRFALAGDQQNSVFVPLAMSAVGDVSMAPQNSGRSTLERAGLSEFSSRLFLDQRLLDSSVVTLLGEADFIRYQSNDPTPLTGLHAALDIDEATLIAVPDAMHLGWHRVSPAVAVPPIPSAPLAHPAWWHALACDPPASPPADAREPEWGNFLACGLRVLTPPVLAASGPDVAGAFTLGWTQPDANVVFILEEASRPDFSDADELYRGTETDYRVLERPFGDYYYRVRAEAGSETSDWSNGVVVSIRADVLWQVNAEEDYAPDALLEIQRALLRVCGARGDLLAVLALPEHYREDDALTYLARLKSPTDFGASSILPLNVGEAAAFSYAALYHPWLTVCETGSGISTLPPDGAATGIVARRALIRGAWIAPANEPFARVVALTPRVDPRRYLDLLLAQINLVRQEPVGFLALSADTLSDDPQLRPINVRRLLILLRRTALRLGATYVFEPNDRTLRRVVQGAFGSLLGQLFARGAFAGDTPETSYQVVTGDTVNPPQSVEGGRFHVDLKVAPAWPMSFLTVRLVQIGERATTTEIT